MSAVRVHETVTGYAECNRDDAYSPAMGKIQVGDFEFSAAIRDGWSDADLLEKLANNQPILLAEPEQQVQV